VTLDAFTNATSVLTTPTGWFGIPLGSAPERRITNGHRFSRRHQFLCTGNYAAIGVGSGELDGTLFYNSANNNLQEVQQYISGRRAGANHRRHTLTLQRSTGVYVLSIPPAAR